MSRAVLLAVGLLVAAPLTGFAQTPETSQRPAPSPDFTLNVNAQLVVEDVTVTDSKGQPVTGLPKSAFHLFDNDVPQQNFEVQERTGTAVAGNVSQPQNVYSNAGLIKTSGTCLRS